MIDFGLTPQQFRETHFEKRPHLHTAAVLDLARHRIVTIERRGSRINALEDEFAIELLPDAKSVLVYLLEPVALVEALCAPVFAPHANVDRIAFLFAEPLEGRFEKLRSEMVFLKFGEHI
jgi:hypothetical protein